MGQIGCVDPNTLGTFEENIGKLVEQGGFPDTGLAADDERNAGIFLHTFLNDAFEFVDFCRSSDENVLDGAADFGMNSGFCEAFPASGGFEIGIIDFDTACFFIELVFAE